MSFFNKLSNSITNNASAVLGRENAHKLTNALNSVIYNAKYRDCLKPGNIIQLISKNSHMSVQICSSQNDPNRLIVLGNGQIGPEYRNAHLTVVKDKHGHFKFQSGNNFFAMDEPKGVPCVLSEPTGKKPKAYEFIRARNEFLLHEVIGSEEWFALESVYFAGKYVSITPDGSIGVIKDKSDVSTHFCLHLIYEHPANINPNRQTRNSLPSSISVNGGGMAAASTSAGSASNVSMASSSSTANVRNASYESEQARQKLEESERHAAEQMSLKDAEPVNSGFTGQNADPTPPEYGNLFPTLPGK